MDATTIARVVSLIPERITRAQTGTAFTPEHACASRHPDRFALIVRKLDWLTPLTYLSKDEQRELGLLAANGRLMHAGDQEDADTEAVEEFAEEDLSLDEAEMEFTTPEVTSEAAVAPDLRAA